MRFLSPRLPGRGSENKDRVCATFQKPREERVARKEKSPAETVPWPQEGIQVHRPLPNRNSTPRPFHTHRFQAFNYRPGGWVRGLTNRLEGKPEGIKLMEPVRRGRISPERHLFQAPRVSTSSSELDRDGGAVSGALPLASLREAPPSPCRSVLPSLSEHGTVRAPGS